MISSAFASEPAAPSATTAQTGIPAGAMPSELSPQKAMTDTLIFLLLMFAIFYFLLIRPQQKRLRAHQQMVKEMKKGDKVITAGGIIGTVTKLEGDEILVVEVAPNVRVRVARQTITERLSTDSALAADTANDN